MKHTLFCREIIFVASYVHMGGGGAKKWRVMTRGGGHDTPQKWWRHLWTAPNDLTNFFTKQLFITQIIFYSEILQFTKNMFSENDDSKLIHTG